MLFLVVGKGSYGKPFETFGEITHDTTRIFEVDAIVFTGGHDVSPEIYGQDKHSKTQNWFARDFEEAALFQFAKLRGIPQFGICRGSQFLCVMNEGSLVQHVHNHANGRLHPVSTSIELTLDVTSTHHQMMDLSNLEGGVDFDMLAWAEGLNEDGTLEPEAVEFYDSMSLAVQFHPEYMGEDTEGWKYYQELVSSHLLAYSEKYQNEQQQAMEVDHAVEDMLHKDLLGLH